MKLSWLIGLAGLLAGGVQAEIPMRDFFEHQQFVNMEISPDGQNVAFTFETSTEIRLAVMGLEEKKIKSSFAFGENMHVLDFFWANNERVVMSVGKVTGNLDGEGGPAHLYAANIDGSKRAQIFEIQNSGYRFLHRLPKDNDHILLAKSHFADRGQEKVQKLNIYNGKIYFQPDQQPRVFNPFSVIADNSGEVRLAVEFVEGKDIDSHQTVIHAKHGDVWKKIAVKSTRKQPQFDSLGFNADNSRAYFTSDFDENSEGRMGVFEYDFGTEQMKLYYRDAEVDVANGIYGHNGDVLGVFLNKGKGEYLYFTDKDEDSKFFQSLELSFKGQQVAVTSYTEDGKKAIVNVRSDRNPGEFYLFDIASMKAKFLAAAMPKLKAEQLAEMEPVTITARDGLKLHAFLTRPLTKKEKLPLIVNVHGGPFGPFDFWGYDREAHFFADRGYATLQVNFRGSGNRGKDFMDKGRRGWGGVMQDDVTDATKWAIEQGIADPERICIYGGSYGGYATLAGVIKEPDLYKCGVGYVGVYDMIWFRGGDGSDGDRNFSSDQKKAREQWMSAYVGDDKEFLRSISPVHNVSKIKAEMAIVHGTKDVRVPVGHYERLTKALDKIGKPYESMLKPEGHGFYQVDNRVALYTMMLDFFERHIGEKRKTAAN